MLAQLQAALEDALGERPLHLVPVAEEPPWSRTFLVTLPNGARQFVKGSPRALGEGAITAYLARRCPAIVSVVLHPDLLPIDEWQWFVLEDVGDCERSEVTPELACRAATALGVLQRTVVGDPFLAARLPSCLPEQLTTILEASCAALIQHADAEVCEQARQLGIQLQRVEPALRQASTLLATVPPTCVHGDFWPGNIALHGDELRLIDWGEALWGVGAASIWNLLLTSSATLGEAEASVWKAYSQGLGAALDERYRWAARIAFFVTMLVVDQNIGASGNEDDSPETLDVLQQIVAELDKGAAF